jgi:hypothetical protein
MDCQRFSHIQEGVKVYRAKVSYNTLEEAISVAKVQNLYPNAIHKVVAYKCKVCQKFHLGRNGKEITEKYKKRLESKR